MPERRWQDKHFKLDPYGEASYLSKLPGGLSRIIQSDLVLKLQFTGRLFLTLLSVVLRRPCAFYQESFSLVASWTLHCDCVELLMSHLGLFSGCWMGTTWHGSMWLLSTALSVFPTMCSGEKPACKCMPSCSLMPFVCVCRNWRWNECWNSWVDYCCLNQASVKVF